MFKINHTQANILPNEYHTGEYTSLTDVFYIAVLFNHLFDYISKF